MQDKYIARSSAIAARVMGAETFVMSATDSTLFSLNEVATLIWQAADGATPLAEIVEKTICAEYDVDLTTAYADAAQFVEELAAHGILQLADEPISAARSQRQES